MIHFHVFMNIKTPFWQFYNEALFRLAAFNPLLFHYSDRGLQSHAERAGTLCSSCLCLGGSLGEDWLIESCILIGRPVNGSGKGCWFSQTWNTIFTSLNIFTLNTCKSFRTASLSRLESRLVAFKISPSKLGIAI